MDNHDSDRLARSVHYVLLCGVTLSALFLMVGIPKAFLDRRTEVVAVERPSNPVEIVKAVLDGNGQAILQFGLLILMATPVVRVLVLAIGWGLQRNFHFMVVAMTVLMLLILSIILSVRA